MQGAPEARVAEPLQRCTAEPLMLRCCLHASSAQPGLGRGPRRTPTPLLPFPACPHAPPTCRLRSASSPACAPSGPPSPASRTREGKPRDVTKAASAAAVSGEGGPLRRVEEGHQDGDGAAAAQG